MAVVPNANSCPDCGVAPSGKHNEDCDVARCLVTGDQRLVCRYMRDDDDDHACAADIWTGEWPDQDSIVLVEAKPQ